MTALNMFRPASGGKSRSLVLNRRLIRPTIKAVADALAAAWVAGLSLESIETPGDLLDLPGEKNATQVEILVGSSLFHLLRPPRGNVEDLHLAWVNPEAKSAGLAAQSTDLEGSVLGQLHRVLTSQQLGAVVTMYHFSHLMQDFFAGHMAFAINC